MLDKMTSLEPLGGNLEEVLGIFRVLMIGWPGAPLPLPSYHPLPTVFRRSPPAHPAIRMLFLSRPNVSRFEPESTLAAATPSPESPEVWSDRGL